jgi:CTX phage RstB protein
MKVTILGHEISEGTSKRTGQPYSIGKLHATVPLAQKGAKGFMGNAFDCPPDIIKTIEQLDCPFTATLETQMVMRYGQTAQQITRIIPAK